MKSGPREDSTRIGSAGVVRRQAVDVSPLRRVNQAIYLMTTGVCVLTSSWGAFGCYRV
jgi:small subunit ribosomal protein S5e